MRSKVIFKALFTPSERYLLNASRKFVVNSATSRDGNETNDSDSESDFDQV